MTSVTNKHEGPLNVGGVTVAPGKTADISETQIAVARAGNACRIWEKMGLIVFNEGKKADAEPATPAVPATPAAPAVPGAPVVPGASPVAIPAAPGAPVVPGASPVAIPAAPGADDKDALIERAKELGVKGVLTNMKPDTLKKKIADAEAAS